jgi:hypothetical protein
MPFSSTDSGFEDWKAHKHLTDVGTPIHSATDLDRFLRQQDCDTTTWGLDENTNPVEVLYREVRDNKCALLLQHNDPDSLETGDEQTGQLVRCVFSLRLRIVRPDGDALVQVSSKDAVPIPWHTIQVIDEPPLHAAERVLSRVAGGAQAVCLVSNQAHRGPIPEVLNIDEEKEVSCVDVPLVNRLGRWRTNVLCAFRVCVVTKQSRTQHAINSNSLTNLT